TSAFGRWLGWSSSEYTSRGTARPRRSHDPSGAVSLPAGRFQMKRAFLTAFAVSTVCAVTAFAQGRDFSGSWTVDVEKTVANQPAAVRTAGGGGGGVGGMRSGGGGGTVVASGTEVRTTGGGG